MLSPFDQEDYEKVRYERLKEIVSEYLDDEGGTTFKLSKDLHRAALENSQYFVGRVNEYTELLDLFS